MSAFPEMLMPVAASQGDYWRHLNILGLRAQRLGHPYWGVWKEPSPLPQAKPGEGAASLCCPLGPRVIVASGDVMTLEQAVSPSL